jgi:hypothetical protein
VRVTSTNLFKNALQALTTTVVKAEAAQGSDAAAFETLRAASIAQRQRLRETHATLVAELAVTDPAAPVPYATWFGQTQARAAALFGDTGDSSAA